MSSSTTSNVLTGSDILAGGGNSEVAGECVGLFPIRLDRNDFMLPLCDLKALWPSKLNQVRVDGQPHESFRPAAPQSAIRAGNEVTKRQYPLPAIGSHGHASALAKRGPMLRQFV